MKSTIIGRLHCISGGLLLSPKASVTCQLARAACIWVVVGMQGREAWQCGLWLWRSTTFIRHADVCACVWVRVLVQSVRGLVRDGR